MKPSWMLLALGCGLAAGIAAAQEPQQQNIVPPERPETVDSDADAQRGDSPNDRDARASEPWRETRSENGRFVLRIKGGETERESKAKAVYQATLFEQASEDGFGSDHKRWETRLDNSQPPAAVQIRNDGRYVVVLADSRRDVTRNAVTIYDEKGKRIHTFGLKDLLRARDLRNVKKEKEAVEWLDGARYEFVADKPADDQKEPTDGKAGQFAIVLHWGREIRIDLKTGRPVRQEEIDGAVAEAPADTPEMIAEAETLEQQIAAAEQALQEAERARAAEVAVAEMLQRAEVDPNLPEEMQEQLRAELAARLAEAQAQAMAAELQAREIQQQVEASVAAVEKQGEIGEAAAIDPATAAPPQTAETTAAPETGSKEIESGVPILSEIPVVGQFFQESGGLASYTGNIRPPPPDPAKPVDYIAWANEINHTEGPNAGPLLQAAVSNMMEFQGEAEVFDRAMKGDAEALRSPEITAWLEANQTAFNQFRQAAQMEYKGMPMHSEDGSLLSVLLPHLAPIRQGSKGMVIEGKLLETEGRYNEAANSYLDVLRTGGQAGQGPTLIENLVGIASQSLASKSLLDVMANAPAGEMDYAGLAQQLETGYQPPRSMADSVQFERGFILDTIQRSFDHDPATGQYRPNAEQMMKVMSFSDNGQQPSMLDQLATRWKIANMDYSQTLKDANAYYDKMTQAFQQTYPQSREALGGMERELESGGIQNPLLRTLIPSLSRANFLRTRGETERQATAAIANIMAWKQQHGSLPDSLEVFGDRNFVRDPFTGQRFQYRKDGDSFTLYSLGGNGVDDGGVHDPKAETNDVLFWPRPKENK